MRRLAKRHQDDEENSLDRRKISTHSERVLAEAYHHQNPYTFMQHAFNIMTGKSVTDVLPVRDVQGDITLSDAVATTLDGDTLVLEVTIGTATDTVFVRADETATNGTYFVPELQDGEYTITVSGVEIRSYDPDTLEQTRYGIADLSVRITDTTININTTTTNIGDTVSGSLITVESLTRGAEIQGDT